MGDPAGLAAAERRLRLVWLALALCAALGILAGGAAWNWVGKRFPGFLASSDWTVSAIALPAEWPGTLGGLRPGDRVLELDSKPLEETPGQYLGRIRSEPMTLLHTVGVMRGKARFSVQVPTPEFSLRDFGYAFGPLLAAGLAGVAIAAYLLTRRDLTAGSVPVAWAGIALGAWSFVRVLEGVTLSFPGLQAAAAAGVGGAAIGLLGGTGAGARLIPRLAWLLAPLTLLALAAEMLAGFNLAWPAAWVPSARLAMEGAAAIALAALAGFTTWQAASPLREPGRHGGTAVALLLWGGLAVAAVAAMLRAGTGTTPIPLGWVALAF
ncbi:MAG: hypothetical protein FJZ01_27665, partial [Candidatus Sericytochromatia bacterium]|nr:hypothetical protein [Candidatus Tanganyikabacteria bacterium]